MKRIFSILAIVSIFTLHLQAVSYTGTPVKKDLSPEDILSEIKTFEDSFIAGKIGSVDIEKNKTHNNFKNIEDQKKYFKNLTESAIYNTNPVSYIVSILFQENDKKMIYAAVCSVKTTESCHKCDILNGEGEFKENDIICQSKISEYR